MKIRRGKKRQQQLGFAGYTLLSAFNLSADRQSRSTVQSCNTTAADVVSVRASRHVCAAE